MTPECCLAYVKPREPKQNKLQPERKRDVTEEEGREQGQTADEKDGWQGGYSLGINEDEGKCHEEMTQLR